VALTTQCFDEATFTRGIRTSLIFDISKSDLLIVVSIIEEYYSYSLTLKRRIPDFLFNGLLTGNKYIYQIGEIVSRKIRHRELHA
jgi:hypothetical protein